VHCVQRLLRTRVEVGAGCECAAWMGKDMIAIHNNIIIILIESYLWDEEEKIEVSNAIVQLDTASLFRYKERSR